MKQLLKNIPRPCCEQFHGRPIFSLYHSREGSTYLLKDKRLTNLASQCHGLAEALTSLP